MDCRMIKNIITRSKLNIKINKYLTLVETNRWILKIPQNIMHKILNKKARKEFKSWKKVKKN